MKWHDILAQCSRQERRFLLNRAGRARRTGEWGKWQKFTFPRGTIGRGWSHDIDKVHHNIVFSVLERTLPSGVRHMAVTSLSGERPTWWEMQRIKNELAGDEATAIEVYPPQPQVVDEADMYHIWVLPEPLPFGLSAVKG